MSNGSKDQVKKEKPKLPSDEAFWLTDLYPNASDLFGHDHAAISEVKDNCIVVLDANILLAPYEFNSASIAELEKVYVSLAAEKRLIVPGQAAREFYKHRGSKIAETSKALDQAIARLKNPQFLGKIPLLEEDADYQAANAAIDAMKASRAEAAGRLAKINATLKDDVGSDRVSTMYRTVLTDCVADLEMSGENSREKLFNECARRARLEIAPGFEDHDKADSGIGDLIIWKTVLQEAARTQTHCILVTNDQKADWWVTSPGPFQPRPELIEEYRRASGGKSLHMMPLSGLLVTFGAGSQAVEQAQDLERSEGRKIFDEAVPHSAFSVDNNIPILLLLGQLQIQRENTAIEIAALSEEYNTMTNATHYSDTEKERLFENFHTRLENLHTKLAIIDREVSVARKLPKVDINSLWKSYESLRSND